MAGMIKRVGEFGLFNIGGHPVEVWAFGTRHPVDQALRSIGMLEAC